MYIELSGFITASFIWSQVQSCISGALTIVKHVAVVFWISKVVDKQVLFQPLWDLPR